MTKEQQIDWLCRLKSEIKIFMPDKWQKPFEEALDMAIKAPEQEPRWIPVNEKLPRESGRYLISVLDGVGKRITVASYQPRYKAWAMTGRRAYWKVVAWMPLPEPYKAETEKT
jgi:hypothetical protein